MDNHKENDFLITSLQIKPNMQEETLTREPAHNGGQRNKIKRQSCYKNGKKRKPRVVLTETFPANMPRKILVTLKMLK